MDNIREYGMIELDDENSGKHFLVISIIGEIEGHNSASEKVKTTKYEHVIPTIAEVEDNDEIDGLLVILNTVGGDVECGLALAELIASLRKPTVTLVIGGSHSIGIPLAVATNDSFIVPTATMLVHPVRMNGTLLGAPQTYYQFNQMQDRIVSFISSHTKIEKDRLESLMLAKDTMAKDLGTILVGKNAVEEGLIAHVGDLQDAIESLEKKVEEKKEALKW